MRVSIAAPPPLLLGATNRLLVKVTAVVSNKNESAALSSSSSSLLSMSSTQAATELSPSFNKNNRNEEKTNPFSNALLFLESEPAPVPPPPVVTVTLETAAASEDGGAAKQQQQQQPALLASSARPRAERAFFWAPAQASLPPSGDGAGGPAGDQEIARVGTEGDGGVAGFLPMAVGSDGQPVEGIPLLKTASSAIVAAATPAAAADSAASGLAADIAADIAVVAAGSSDSGEGEVTVTVPVWVRSETAGKVAVRARVVFGGEGMAVVAADAQRAGGSGHSVVGSTAGGASVGHVKAATAGGWQGAAVTATEWARAEVLCVRPLAAAVDVITLQVKRREMSRVVHLFFAFFFVMCSFAAFS